MSTLKSTADIQGGHVVALRRFLKVWREGMLLEEIGPVLSCMEADALANLLAAFGYVHSARVLIASHVREDDEGDDPAHWALKQELEKEE